MSRLFFSALLLPLCLLLTACGQRGLLYLPTESRVMAPPKQSAPGTIPEDTSQGQAPANTAVPTTAPDNPPYVTPVPPIQ